VIDLHSHILPGLDDGARTIEDSRELAERALADGITAIAATPHVRADYPTTPDQMEAGVAALRADFAAHGIGVDVVHGGEIDLEALETLGEDELRRFSLGQSGRYVLIETPYRGWPLDMEQRLFGLSVLGLVPVLAHPERNAEVQEQLALLGPLVEQGALVQITAASLDGRIGKRSKETAKKLIRDGLAHLVASDAHTPEIREVGLTSAVASLGDAELAAYLTEKVPAAVLAGEAVPDRPRRRRRGLLRRSG
jgi:protein-tyrosine phosphatase